MTHPIKKIAVIGAGTMGHGIAQVAATAGYSVALYDSDQQILTQAKVRIEALLQKGVQRHKLTAQQAAESQDRVTYVDLKTAVEGAGLVIESIVEDLASKQQLFAQLQEMVSSETVLASNTSSLPISKIASAVSCEERVVGMHFFNPAHIMKLVEVVVPPETSQPTLDLVLEVASALGKDPIVVKDSPGFASSRLGIVLGLEAMRMFEQGVASVEDIDKAMELGYRHPMGPLKLTDLVGLDVRLSIADILHRELGGDQYRPPEILRKKVAAGELGKKSGRGFYDWEE